MSKQDKVGEKPNTNKDKRVHYRCDTPLILDFDNHAAKANKTRSQVLRELMVGWMENRKTA